MAGDARIPELDGYLGLAAGMAPLEGVLGYPDGKLALDGERGLAA